MVETKTGITKELQPVIERGLVVPDQNRLTGWLKDSHLATEMVGEMEKNMNDLSRGGVHRMAIMVDACANHYIRTIHGTDERLPPHSRNDLTRQVWDKLAEQTGNSKADIYREGFTQTSYKEVDGDDEYGTWVLTGKVETEMGKAVEEIVEPWMETESMQAKLAAKTADYDSAEELFNKELNRAKGLQAQVEGLTEDNEVFQAQVESLEAEVEEAKEDKKAEVVWDDAARVRVREIYDQLPKTTGSIKEVRDRVNSMVDASDVIAIDSSVVEEPDWQGADESAYQVFDSIKDLYLVYNEARSEAPNNADAKKKTQLAVTAVERYIVEKGLVEPERGKGLSKEIVHLMNRLRIAAKKKKVEGVSTTLGLVEEMPGVLKMTLEERRQRQKERLVKNKERVEVEKYFEDTQLVALYSTDADGQRIDLEWLGKIAEAETLGLDVELGEVRCDLGNEIAPEAVIGLGFDQMEFPEVNLVSNPDNTKVVLDGNLIIQSRIPGWQYEAGAEEGLLIKENQVIARVTVKGNKVSVTREDDVEPALWLDGVVALGESFSRIVDQEPSSISRLMLRSEGRAEVPTDSTDEVFDDDIELPGEDSEEEDFTDDGKEALVTGPTVDAEDGFEVEEPVADETESGVEPESQRKRTTLGED